MNKTIKHSWRVLLLAPLLLAFVVYVNNGYKTNKPICPDDFKDAKEEIASFNQWADKFWENNPNATTRNFSHARVNFWRENNCTEALKRYDDYMAGNVDEQTKQLIEGVIGEKIAKNQENSACPNDFASISEEFISLGKWWEDFTIKNPDASMPEMLRERRNFYIENNCVEDLAIHDEFFAGKTDKEINNLVEVELYNKKIYNLMENEKYNEAISLANEYLKKNPKSIDMWIHKSMAYYYLGDCKNASISIKKAQEMVAEDPTSKDLVEKLSVGIILDSDNICKR